MKTKTDEVIEKLNLIKAEALASFGSMNAVQLNWRADESSWGVGQCLDHIIRTNNSFVPDLKTVANGDRKNSFWENYSPFSGIFGNLLIGFQTKDKKFKAPSKKVIPPIDIDEDIVTRFTDHIDKLTALISQCIDADLRKTKLTSPLMSLITYSLDDALTVIVEHSRRHMRQATRVAQHPMFPAK